MYVKLLPILLVINAVSAQQQSSALFSSHIDVSESCKVAVQRLSTLQASEPQLMARYWDSWGKPSDSILTGHTTFLGYYDECINLKNTALGNMKYCIYPMIMDNNINHSPSDSDDDVCHSSNCPSTAVNVSIVMKVKVGVCYPSACSANEFGVVLSKMNITSVTTMTSDPFSDTTNTVTIRLHHDGDAPSSCPAIDAEYDAGTKVVIVVCVILAGIVMVGTTLDIVVWPPSSSTMTFEENKKPKDSVSKTAYSKEINKNHSLTHERTHDHPTIKHFILAFSLYTTVPNLLKRQSPSALKALGAIKIFSNLIIVTYHAQQFIVLLLPATIQNTYLQQLASKLMFQPIINANLAVETFFVVSGTLSTYLTLKDMEKHKTFRFKYFYLHRILRLSPLLFIYTIIAYKLFPHFGQGPAWSPFDAQACKNTWWYVLIYLGNTGYMQNGMTQTCMGMTWHIAADMQLFMVSPIFIILLYRVWYVGLATVAVTMVAATVTVGYVSAANGYWAAMIYNPQVAQQATEFYNKAYFRANSYLTGILLGYILYKKFHIAKLPIGNCLKWLTYALLWGMAIMLCTITIFWTYGAYSNTYQFSHLENVIYLTFSGLAWSIGIAIIIYICNTGYGGVVNSFLSWPGWEPLVKLNYGVTLNHMMMLLYVVGTLQSSLKYTDAVFAMVVVFILALSYSFSAITAVFVEQPVSRVVSLCFKLAGMEVRSK